MAASLASPGAASAHASLVSSQPRDGQVLASAPTSVVLRFDENVRRPAYVVVTAPDGRQVQSGQAQVLDNTVTEQVTASGPGRYGIAYRVVSADGHPVTAQLSFTVSGVPRAAAAASCVSSSPASGQGSAARTGGGSLDWQPVALVAVLGVAVAVLLAPVVRRKRR